MTIINIEASAKRDNREAEGNALTCFYAKQAVLTKDMILIKPQR